MIGSSRSCLRLTLALAVLLFVLPLGAVEVPAVVGAQSESAAGPIFLSKGQDGTAAPKSGTPRQGPEGIAAAVFLGAVSPGDLQLASSDSIECASLSSRTPLYLRHCALLC